MNGYKGDLLLWILAPSLEDLAKWERKFRRLTIASVLVQTYSYTSVPEVSAYVKAKLDTPEVFAKLYQTVPKDKYICF
ncbi:chlorite dismutase family protein, partial [Veillonella atypica]